MKLAEKIILLRKQKGWSQEELAAQMDVSRQSVSKWESGASTPDIDKIILLSQIFGTTTDYLLKEEIEVSEEKTYHEELKEESTQGFYDRDMAFNNETKPNIEEKKIFVSRTEAEEFLNVTKQTATRIAFGVLLCICSAAPMMFLLGLQHTGNYGITEDMAAIVGVCILLVVIAIAVTLFIVNGIKISKFEFIEKEVITLDLDVSSEIKNKSEEFAPVFARNIAFGVVLCIISVMPLLLAAIEKKADGTDNEALIIGMVGVLLIVVAIGVYRFVKVGIVKDSFDKLLQQGEYTAEKKMNNKKNDTFSAVYWMIMTAIYLAYSFITMDWGDSWIIWPVAGVLYAAIITILNATRNKKEAR